MAPKDQATRLREKRNGYGPLGTLLAGWRAMREHRRERRAIVAISRLDPHLIRDLGFDPDVIYESLDGTWDEVDPGRFRNRLPWRDRP